jgi:hypothetical protein
MASSTVAGNTGWYRGRVKAVPSGDCLVIVAISTPKPGQTLPERTITLSSLIAPRLVIHFINQLKFILLVIIIIIMYIFWKNNNNNNS